MSRSGTVLFVSAGMLRPKKRDHPLARRQVYLNYGALTLASQLSRSGQPAVLAHGLHDGPGEFLAALVASGLLPSVHPVMLSLPSFYALPWAQVFCRRLKDAFPDAQIVVGGRWVTNPDPEWVRRKLPEADEVVCGLGETQIDGLLGLQRPKTPPGSLPDFSLDHRLVQGFQAFQPSIEASRGCGMGCAFCEERAIRLTKLKPAAQLADHMQEVAAQYSGESIHPYLQSSFFMPTPRWAEALRKEVAARGLTALWRTETRVDAMLPVTVEHLAAAGLKVIDLGLESASPRQILAMQKSSKPDRYLRLASDLLNACRANGVWVKVNILMYAGETAETFAETRAWLDEHAGAIKGVSVGPVLVYGPPKQAAPLLEEMAAQGACPVDPSQAEAEGISQLHLSSAFDAEAAEAASLELSRRHMTADDYYDLKAFSYYPRGYDRTDFDADVAETNRTLLPFTT